MFNDRADGLSSQSQKSPQNPAFSAVVITYHKIGKNFHHPDRNINVHGFHQRNGPVDDSGIFHLRHYPAGRIIIVGIFAGLFHKHTVKFFLQNNVRNNSFCSHLIYIRMTCGVQNIMTAKSKKICKECLIVISSDLPHPFFKKGSCLLMMHLNPELGDRIL